MTIRNQRWLALAAALLVPLSACGDLEVSNPNAPERERAFSDPATIVAAAAGTMKSWANSRWAYDPALTMSAMADSYSASWNNFNMRYYSSYAKECPNRCGWVNSTSTQLGLEIESYWYGMYSTISSANDALFAIRLAANKPDLGTNEVPTEIVAQMASGAAHGFLALNYDRAFIVTEDVDTPEELAALELSDKDAVRDAAIAMLETAITQAKANTFTTGATTFGVPTGPTYTNLQLAKIMRTMQAEMLALHPRSAEQNAQVDWDKVVEYASQGISSNIDGAPFDFEAFVSEQAYNEGTSLTTSPATAGYFSGFHNWGNDYTTVRVDTRVGRLLSTTQGDPWPGGAGSPRPATANGTPIGGIFGVDKRLGDGCLPAPWGDDDLFGVGECGPTANSGTDFMWSPVAIMNPTRGSEHQSNLGSIRDHCLVGGFPDCPTGSGNVKLFTRWHNDLLWAEGLIRGDGDLALAADLINRSRVGRGGLAPVSAGNTKTELLAALIYEQEIEGMPIAFAAYANRRRWTTEAGAVDPPAYNALWPDTPRQMPIPAKDLQLLQLEIYSFGGPGGNPGLSRVRNVREIWADIYREMKPRSRMDRR